MNFSVFGAGAWGTAMAIYLDRLGHRVTLVPRRDAHLSILRQTRQNHDYLPGMALRESIDLRPFGSSVIRDADVCVLASPSFALRTWCDAISHVLGDDGPGDTIFLSLAKGLEQDSLKMPSEIMLDELPGARTAVLSGPNFAIEVAMGKPTAGVIAAPEGSTYLGAVQEELSSTDFRFYRSFDIVGVELGGCLKNIYAIAAGICDGLDLGDNAKSALITRSLHEMVRLVTRLGGAAESVYGLSGFGDLVATCFGQLSRNRSLGEELGRGRELAALMEHRKSVVEGYGACRCFHHLCAREGIQAPIMEQIYRVLFQHQSPTAALNDLMMRELKEEGQAPDTPNNGGEEGALPSVLRKDS